MIEGGAIDWANHSNNLQRAIEEQIDFNNSVKAVMDWIDDNSSWEETLRIVTADRETGNLWGTSSVFSQLGDNGAATRSHLAVRLRFPGAYPLGEGASSTLYGPKYHARLITRPETTFKTQKAPLEGGASVPGGWHLIPGLLRYDIGRAGAFLALFDVEGDGLTFGQRLESTCLDGAVVDEYVLSAIGRGDEAEAFFVVEPLNCTCSHYGYLC